MEGRTRFIVLLSLQAIVIASFLYLALRDTKSPDCDGVPRGLSACGSSAPQEDQYVMSNDDMMPLKTSFHAEQPEVEEHEVSQIVIARSTALEMTRDVELDTPIPGELFAKLQRYEFMSNEEKRQVDAEMAELMSDELESLKKRFSDALDEMELRWATEQKALSGNRDSEPRVNE